MQTINLENFRGKEEELLALLGDILKSPHFVVIETPPEEMRPSWLDRDSKYSVISIEKLIFLLHIICGKDNYATKIEIVPLKGSGFNIRARIRARDYFDSPTGWLKVR